MTSLKQNLAVKINKQVRQQDATRGAVKTMLCATTLPPIQAQHFHRWLYSSIECRWCIAK